MTDQFPKVINGYDTAGLADPRVLLSDYARRRAGIERPGRSAPWITGYYAPVSTVNRDACGEIIARVEKK